MPASVRAAEPVVPKAHGWNVNHCMPEMTGEMESMRDKMDRLEKEMQKTIEQPSSIRR